MSIEENPPMEVDNTEVFDQNDKAVVHETVDNVAADDQQEGQVELEQEASTEETRTDEIVVNEETNEPIEILPISSDVDTKLEQPQTDKLVVEDKLSANETEKEPTENKSPTDIELTAQNDNQNSQPKPQGSEDSEKLRVMEEMHIGPATEILFPATTDATNAWDNLRWMSLSGSRRISFSRVVFRRFRDQSTILLWKSQPRITFPARLLVLYQHPQVLLILRRAIDLEELRCHTDVDFNDVVDVNDEERARHLIRHYWIAESVMDLAACRMQLSNITTHHLSKVINNIRHDREVSCFSVSSPSETVCLSSVQLRPNAKSKRETSFSDSGAFMETTSTETAISQAICQAQQVSADQEAEDLMWKHQVILGTLHAYVLSGNTKALQEALDRAWLHLNSEPKKEEVDSSAEVKNAWDDAWKKLSGQSDGTNGVEPKKLHEPRTLPSSILDEPDENGCPPIYYACRLRMVEAMALLVQYGASVDYVAKATNETLLHVCARSLNVAGLEALLKLQKGRVGDNLNAINMTGETPLFVAVVYGSLDVRSTSNSFMLGKCIELLKTNGGRFFPATVEDCHSLQHPLLTLAMDYRKDDLAVLLEHLSLEFPLSGILDVVVRTNSVVVSRNVLESLGALYDYPLHRVLAKLFQEIRSQEYSHPHLNKQNLVGTIHVLLMKGFEANERIEAKVEEASTQTEEGPNEELLEFVGFAPIQILAAAAIELEVLGPMLSESVYGELDSILSSLCEELIKVGGARISLDAPTLLHRPLKQKPAKQKTSMDCSSGGDATPVDRCSLKIDANDHLMHLLGGRSRLEKAQSFYTCLECVMVPESRAPRRNDSTDIEDVDVRGGNNDRSCAICWKAFSFLNRKHRCRISWRHVCDECSTKRIVVNGKEYRVSDGQFVFAKVAAAKGPGGGLRSNSNVCYENQPDDRNSSTTSSLARVRQQRLEAEEKANRDSLFGAMEQTSKILFDKKASSHERPVRESQDTDGLMNTLGETRNALLDRGDKLNTLNEKTEKMVSTSEDFAKMASELRKQSERGFFW